MIDADGALLVLEDGSRFPGVASGARGSAVGEVVFNTSLTGYQEILTDPSYHRQIVVMTAAHIGNYGTTPEDDESDRAWPTGFVMRSASRIASNWRSTATLEDYLTAHGVVSLTEVDTRSLVRHIRARGAMRAALANDGTSAEALLEMALGVPDMNGLDLCSEVTTRVPYTWPAAGVATPLPLQTSSIPADVHQSGADDPHWGADVSRRGDEPPIRVVALDFGVKRNALRRLAARGCSVTVVPAFTSADDILDMHPDGVFLSSGPGDPAAVGYATATVRSLLGRVPIFGICMGHQLLALALGARTYKLKFGHRGGNQPVRVDGRVQISAHNHGFAVEAASLPAGIEVSHVNLNDGCVEGLRAPSLRAFSVQYHPEAAPGPHDADAHFDDFLRLMAGQTPWRAE